MLSLNSLGFYIKCNDETKIKHLFNLYDLNKEGGILKEEFYTMVSTTN
jgi:Ca2+-binding EF-hand superfamily protein